MSNYNVIVKQPKSFRILMFQHGYKTKAVHTDNKEQLTGPWGQLCSSNVHNSTQPTDSHDDDDDGEDTESSEDSDNDEDGDDEDDGEYDTTTSRSDSTDLRCCLLSACCETCTCCNMPKKCDVLYNHLQIMTKACPGGCPTIVPKQEEEEWKYPRYKGASEFAICQCCYSPGGIICMKYLDILCCPLCPLWDLCKGFDYGYRRFRIQVILDRYKDSQKRHYITFI
uniref:Uncharacterized protein n=1 Tax=Trichobilharzia regenti TaxID=157069 RepID=A0AA85KDQ7_TRIRE|nr:unnamed protein product [Trichobilharzia regenti]